MCCSAARRLLALGGPLLLAGLLFGRCACPQATGACSSRDDCLGNEVCIEEICRRTCNADDECSLDGWCNNGACMPGTRPIDRDAGEADDAGAADALSVDTALPDIVGWDLSIPVDAGGSDQATPDTAQLDTAQRDTTLPDTTLPDTTLPDTTLPDTTLPDTTLPDTTLPDTWRPTCDQQYGGASSYLLCQELTDRCQFAALTNESCADFCGRNGGACIEAFDDSTPGVSCDIDTAHHCLEPHNDQVCVCTRGSPHWPDGGLIDSGSYADYCDLEFSGLPGYRLCTASASACEIFVDGFGDDCETICDSRNHDCVDGYGDLDNTCTRDNNMGCNTVDADLICLCDAAPD